MNASVWLKEGGPVATAHLEFVTTSLEVERPPAFAVAALAYAENNLDDPELAIAKLAVVENLIMGMQPSDRELPKDPDIAEDMDRRFRLCVAVLDDETLPAQEAEAQAWELVGLAQHAGTLLKPNGNSKYYRPLLGSRRLYEGWALDVGLRHQEQIAQTRWLDSSQYKAGYKYARAASRLEDTALIERACRYAVDNLPVDEMTLARAEELLKLTDLPEITLETVARSLESFSEEDYRAVVADEKKAEASAQEANQALTEAQARLRADTRYKGKPITGGNYSGRQQRKYQALLAEHGVSSSAGQLQDKAAQWEVKKEEKGLQTRQGRNITKFVAKYAVPLTAAEGGLLVLQTAARFASLTGVDQDFSEQLTAGYRSYRDEWTQNKARSWVTAEVLTRAYDAV